MAKQHEIEFTAWNDQRDQEIRISLKFDERDQYNMVRRKVSKLLIDEWAALDALDNETPAPVDPNGPITPPMVPNENSFIGYSPA